MSSCRRLFPGLALLFVLVAAVYAQTAHFGFLVYDDDEYVTANPLVKNGLSWPAVVRSWTSDHAANYHPLTWLSHMVDVSLFGLDPGAHHLVNLAFHLANTALLYLLLAAVLARPGPAVLAAGLFALHPLHVESVAWISERKDLLAALFGLLALGAYGRWARGGGRGDYLLAVFATLCSLLAKPMLVTMGFLLLVLDYWPLARWRRRDLPRLLLEKLPFFLLAAVFSAVTLWAQARGGAIQPLDAYPLGVRLATAVYAGGFYLWKLLWPAGLAVIYPHPGRILPLATAGSAIVLLGLGLAAWRWRRHEPWFLAGLAWYLVALIPVCGLVQVGYQAVADRYTYLPLLGPMVAAALAADALGRRWDRRPAAVLAVGFLVVLAVLAHRQVGYWRDSVTLFHRALAVTRDNFVAENHLGLAALAAGRLPEAAAHFRRTLAIKPDHPGAANNLGLVALRQRRWQAAETWFRRALAQRPGFAPARDNLALALVFQGRLAEAVTLMEESLRLRPDNPVVLDNLGNVLLRLGQGTRAEGCFRRAVALDPGFAAAWLDLALVLDRRGAGKGARAAVRRALELEPDNQRAAALLGRLEADGGRPGR